MYKLLFILFIKEDYVIHKGNLKQALNHRLVLKKCLLIKFNKKA